MNWLLDTNVLSEVRKGERAKQQVWNWFAATREQELFTSVLVMGEIRRGIESVRRRDVPTALALDQWLLWVTRSFGDRILPVDARIAERWGALSVPNPLPTFDGLLAATALVHDLTLVTRDVRGVERTGVRLLNPWIVAA